MLSLHWRHSERHGGSVQWQLFFIQPFVSANIKETPKPALLALCYGNPPVNAGVFPSLSRLFHVPRRRAYDCPRPLKKAGNSLFFKILPVQQSTEEETPFVYVTLPTLVTLATAGYTPCLFGYVTIGLARYNRTHFSQSERLLVKPKRPCTDLCAEPVGVWNKLPH